MQRETCIVDVNKSTLRAQVKDGVYLWIFVQIALSLFATSTDMGFVFLLGDDRRAGKPFKIPVILGCTAPGLLYAFGNSLTIMNISQPITNRK